MRAAPAVSSNSGRASESDRIAAGAATSMTTSATATQISRRLGRCCLAFAKEQTQLGEAAEGKIDILTVRTCAYEAARPSAR